MSRKGQLFVIISILVLALASAAAQEDSSTWDKKNEIAGLVERDFASGHAITSPTLPPDLPTTASTSAEAWRSKATTGEGSTRPTC